MTEKPRRILVVEDEAIVAMMVEDYLLDFGYEVVGPAMRLKAAMALARDMDVDAAILDVNLADETSFPVAAILRERGIPFLFATGYGRKGVAEAYQDAVTLEKPFKAEHLRQALVDVLG